MTHRTLVRDGIAPQSDKVGSGKQLRKIRNDLVPEFKKVTPSNNEAKTKTRYGKAHHWCDEHMAWTLHTPEECKLRIERGKVDKVVLYYLTWRCRGPVYTTPALPRLAVGCTTRFNII